VERGAGEIRFPQPPADAGRRPAHPGRTYFHLFIPRGHGETRFPHTPARGRVWAGYTLEQGDGEPGVPHPLTWWGARRSRVGPNY